MSAAHEAQALNLRIWLACLATQELLCTYLGVRLGLYDCLAVQGPAVATQLAARAGIAPRYAREWLEQQAVAGILVVDAVDKPANERRYTLPHSHADVLTSSANILSRVASVLPLGGVAEALPQLLEAYRTGAGLPDAAFGAAWRDGHADSNRALFLHKLAPWLRRVLPALDRQLAIPKARIADVACGAGWASIALARAYPQARINGFDLDEHMIERAKANAIHAGVADRVVFEVCDWSVTTVVESYDLVCLFDALHELPLPVDVLRACRTACRPDGGVLVIDAKVGERFAAPGDEIERFQYTTSVLHCLPVCMLTRPSAETGTVMREDTVRSYANAAEIRTVEVLDSDDRFHRYYWLVP